MFRFFCADVPGELVPELRGARFGGSLGEKILGACVLREVAQFLRVPVCVEIRFVPSELLRVPDSVCGHGWTEPCRVEWWPQGSLMGQGLGSSS